MRRLLFPLCGWMVSVAFVCPAHAIADEISDLYRNANAANESNDYDRGMELANRILRIDPNQPGAYVTRSNSYLGKGDYEQAIGNANKALAMNPNASNESMAYNNRGWAYHKMGQDNKAVADFTRATEIDGNNAQPFINLGVVAADRGQYKEALENYARAIEVQPNNPKGYNSSAWILATCPDRSLRDGKKAWEYAKKAYEFDPDRPNHMGTLAAAFAACDDFDEAIRWIRKAIEARKDSDKEGLNANREQLKRYEQHELYLMERPK